MPLLFLQQQKEEQTTWSKNNEEKIDTTEERVKKSQESEKSSMKQVALESNSIKPTDNILFKNWCFRRGYIMRNRKNKTICLN